MTATITSVPFTVPEYTQASREAVLRVLDSGWTTTGPECAAFETEFASYLGVPHVVTVASCTQALELSLRALRLPAGAPVLTPSLTFSGAVGAIVHAGYRPVLVDINADTLVPDEETVERAARRVGGAAAMVVCHLGGYPVDVGALADAARLPASRIVQDVAHGPGGALTGQDAFAACFSFYATKNLPIGEGGAVATYDSELAAWLQSARLHGMSRDAWRRYLPGGSWRYDVGEIGFKANLTDMQAAIARAQLPAVPMWQARRAELAEHYDQALADRVRLPRRDPGHAWHLYQMRVPGRDMLAAHLAEVGVGASVHFIPVHQLTGYAALFDASERQSCPVTDAVADELLSLPLYPSLTDAQQDVVIDAVNAGLGRSS
jgi:dTDP-4-amino-4,6-dideoxygalactose transaminase